MNDAFMNALTDLMSELSLFEERFKEQLKEKKEGLDWALILISDHNASNSRLRSLWSWLQHNVLRLLLRVLLQPEVPEVPLGNPQSPVLQALHSQGEPDGRKVN